MPKITPNNFPIKAPPIISSVDPQNRVSFSPDGIYAAIPSDSAPYITIYKKNSIDNSYDRLPYPSTMPPSVARDAIFSPDGNYLAVGHSSSPYFTVYKRSGDTFTKLANPSSLPTSNITNVSYSQDGAYLLLGSSGTPYIYAYKQSGDTFTKLTIPTAGAAVHGITFSPDGIYALGGLSSAPYFVTYKRNGDTFTTITNPPSLPSGTARRVSFTPDGNYVAIISPVSPFISIYKNNRDDTFTKLANPTTLPTGAGQGVTFSPDGNYLAVGHLNSPFITIYKRNGETFTKLPNPTVFPAGHGAGVTFSPDGNQLYILNSGLPNNTVYRRENDVFINESKIDAYPTGTGNGTAFSPDGKYMAVAHEITPFISIYKIINGVFTKLPNPASLPPNTALSVSFSPDGNYLAVGHASSPCITIYKRSGDAFTKLANPSSLPTGSGKGVAFSSNGNYLACAHLTTPFLTLYKRDGDTFTKLANPDVLPTGTGNSVSFTPDGNHLVLAHGVSPFVSFYKRNGDDTFTKLANPSALPPSTGNCVSISPDGTHVVIASPASPYISVYKNNGDDTFTKLSNLSPIPPSNTLACRFSVDGSYLFLGISAAPYFVAYKRSGDTYTSFYNSDSQITGAGNGVAQTSSYISVASDTSPFMTTLKFEELIKFLIQDGTNIKKWDSTLTPAAWSTVGSSPVTANMFETYGMDNLNGVDDNLASLTNNPDILFWSENSNPIAPKARLTTKQEKLLLSNKDIDHLYLINNVLLHASIPLYTTLKMIVSTDGGVSWKGKTTVNVGDFNTIITNGYSLEEFNSLTSAELNTLIPNGIARFGFYIKQDGSTIDTIISNLQFALNSGVANLGQTSPDSNTFTSKGITDLSTFPVDTLDSTFDVLGYTADVSTTSINMDIDAAPIGQTVLPNGDLNISDFTNIDYFRIDASELGAGKIRVVVSFDSGTTWNSIAGATWNVIDINNIATQGMTVSAINGISSDNWNLLRGTSDLVRFAYYIQLDDVTDTANIDALKVQGDMTSRWLMGLPGVDYTYQYADSATLQVTLLKSGSFKINY